MSRDIEDGPNLLQGSGRFRFLGSRGSPTLEAVGGGGPVVEVGFAEGPGGGRIAHAGAGDGPPLVLVPGWLSHVRELWTHPAAASALAKLSDGHRFTYWDRLGCGMSDRVLPEPSLENDVAQLLAVLDHLGVERCDLLGYSFGGPPAVVFAQRHPERVRHLVLYSTYAWGAELADEATFGALVDLVRSGWGLASATLAAVFLPDGSADDRRWFARFQRLSADATVAAELLGYVRRQDVRELLGELRVPVTVISAIDDRVIRPDQARTLARGVPGARLVLVDGRSHDPFIRDDGNVVEAILAAVEGRAIVVPSAPVAPTPTEPLTPRELDVLRAVVGGSPNKGIAAELGVSVATVERHLSNLYRKLGVAGRAEAAARAVREGLVGR
jgi:pimeloyl-ACP methyl ester carboxylesterase/DNA-binding CsgD family transcriptional regulator